MIGVIQKLLRKDRKNEYVGYSSIDGMLTYEDLKKLKQGQTIP